jgi:hypothetical protein
MASYRHDPAERRKGIEIQAEPWHYRWAIPGESMPIMPTPSFGDPGPDDPRPRLNRDSAPAIAAYRRRGQRDRFIHNVIAHPLLVLWPRLGEWLHDHTVP